MTYSPGYDPLSLGYGQDGTIDGSASRATGTLRWDVLDSSHNPVGTITPGRTGGLTADQDGNANRSIRGVTLNQATATDLNPAVDRLRPVWVDALDTDWPLGVYRIAAAENVHLALAGEFRGLPPVDVTLADEQSRLLANNHRSVSFPRDETAESAAQRLAGLLDIPDLQVVPTTDETAEPQSWALGETAWADIASTVAGGVGLLAPWFDNDGVWRWVIPPRPDTDPPDHEFPHWVYGTHVRAVTLLDEPNVWYAVNAAARTGRIVGRYELPAFAPNSVARLGYEIPERVERAGLASSAAADNAARAAYLAHVATPETATITVPFTPTVDLYQTCRVDGRTWRIVGWSHALPPTTMELSLVRVFTTADEAGTLLGGMLGGTGTVAPRVVPSAVLADAVVVLRASEFVGVDGDNWANEGTGGSAYDAVADPVGATDPHYVTSPEPGFEMGGVNPDPPNYQVPNGTAIDADTGSFTVAARILYKGPDEAFAPIVAKITGTLTVDADGWLMATGTALGPGVGFVISDGTPTIAAAISTTELVAGTEYLLVGRVDRTGNTIKLFVDGVEVASANASTVADVTSTNPIIISRSNTAAQTGRSYAYWSRALTASEIANELPSTL